jgi:hypothetical protein
VSEEDDFAVASLIWDSSCEIRRLTRRRGQNLVGSNYYKHWWTVQCLPLLELHIMSDTYSRNLPWIPVLCLAIAPKPV